MHRLYGIHSRLPIMPCQQSLTSCLGPHPSVPYSLIAVLIEPPILKTTSQLELNVSEPRCHYSLNGCDKIGREREEPEGTFCFLVATEEEQATASLCISEKCRFGHGTS
jgi:hypothetical protein